MTLERYHWRILFRVFAVYAVFMMAQYAWSVYMFLTSEPGGPASSPITAGLRAGAFLVTGLILFLAFRLAPGDSRLSLLGISSVAFNVVDELLCMTFSGGDVFLNAFGFMILGFFGLYLLAFMSRKRRYVIIAGCVLAAVGLVAFGPLNGLVFTRPLPTETVRRMLPLFIFVQVLSSVIYLSLSQWITNRLLDRAGEQAAELAELAFRDQETGLPNGQRLERDLAALDETNREAFFLAGIRLEGLGALTARLGIEARNAHVRRAAGLLESTLGDSPLTGLSPLYRTDMDTFVFPLREGGDPETARERISDRIALISERFTQGNAPEPHAFTGRVGSCPDDAATGSLLLRTLLNDLVSGDGPDIAAFVPLNAAHYRDFLRAESLREAFPLALSETELSVRFQPKIDLSNDSLAGFEALCRWNSPAFGSISPTEFIPIVENGHLMWSLTRFVLAETARFLARLRAEGRPLTRISINAPPSLFAEGNLERLINEVRDLGIARRLELEITEGTLFRMDDGIRDGIEALRSQGVTISIDDFGTGYSNLAYLQQFRVDILKIDRCFMEGIPENEANSRLVTAILDIGKSLGIKVVAEGIEKEEQLRFLRENGCDYVQGFVFARPLEPEAALDFGKNSETPD